MIEATTKERIVTVDWFSGKGSPHFFLVAWDGIVVEAPPIAKWCVGKHINIAIKWYKQKGAKISEV